MDSLEQLKFNLGRNPTYHEAEADDVTPSPDVAVRLFAFYLPQFHPIPENDEWWGKGFTEWTNVTKALPRFEGHYQPQLPTDVGFYDLRLVETLRQQVALAKRYGIAGFGFHWYWFSGRRLLERPVDLFLQNPDIDFPFFINWANDNWTRRWDGLENSVLIEQRYSEEDDFSIADAFLSIVKDPRYLRVDGRPVLMVYRARSLPDPAATMERWRKHFVANGEREPLLLMAQVWNENDPRPLGMDGAVQFPPHAVGTPEEDIDEGLNFFNGLNGGHQWDYDSVADNACSRVGDGFALFKTACPAWDNEARKPNTGTSLVGATPPKYAKWLARAIRSTLHDKPLGTNLLFVNAWNEWAEGAHLEPDRHFGHAYLRATCRALNASADPASLDRIIADGNSKSAESAKAGRTPSDRQADRVLQVIGAPASARDRGANASPGTIALDGPHYAEEDPLEAAGILREWMPKACKVLDLGCGTGDVTEFVNRYKRNDVICIEPDFARAEKAQSRDLLVYSGPIDSAFVREHGPFDVVMISNVLHHIAEPAAILKGVHSALAASGHLLLSVPNIAHWSIRLPLLFGRFDERATSMRWFTGATIEQLLLSSGFEIVKQTISAGQYLPEYTVGAPWRWMPGKVRRNLIKAGGRIWPQLFGAQHVLMCRLAPAAARPRSFT